jgi:hypothetical protein
LQGTYLTSQTVTSATFTTNMRESDPTSNSVHGSVHRMGGEVDPSLRLDFASCRHSDPNMAARSILRGSAGESLLNGTDFGAHDGEESGRGRSQSGRGDSSAMSAMPAEQCRPRCESLSATPMGTPSGTPARCYEPAGYDSSRHGIASEEGESYRCCAASERWVHTEAEDGDCNLGQTPRRTTENVAARLTHRTTAMGRTTGLTNVER